MSMISELCEKLQCQSDYIKQTMPELIGMAKLIEEGIVTIKELSAKVHEQNMHDGWISCDERMPEEHNSMFAKFKGTDKWNNAMFEKISDDVIVTVEFNDGTRKTMTMHTTDGEWKSDFSILGKKVIAWKPLPDEYKGE